MGWLLPAALQGGGGHRGMSLVGGYYGMAASLLGGWGLARRKIIMGCALHSWVGLSWVGEALGRWRGGWEGKEGRGRERSCGGWGEP